MAKMILDISHILHASYGGKYDRVIGEGFSVEDLENDVRGDVIQRIISFCNKFNIKYSEMVIAVDSKSWRYEMFPQYKAKRKESREKSSFDPLKQSQFFEKFLKEIETNFPFKMIRAHGAEADDIIGTIAHSWDEEDSEKLIMLSRDHDFLQLIKNNVYLYDPLYGKYITSYRMTKATKTKPEMFWTIKTKEDARKYLLFHILFGDSGDGIPNALCPDDVYTNPLISAKNFGRFGVVTILKKFFTENKEDNMRNLKEFHHTNSKNLNRNAKLIDLSKTPKKIKNEIMKQFRNINNDSDDFIGGSTEDYDKMMKWCDDNALVQLKEGIV